MDAKPLQWWGATAAPGIQAGSLGNVAVLVILSGLATATLLILIGSYISYRRARRCPPPGATTRRPARKSRRMER